MLNESILIEEEFVLMLSQAKIICKLNYILFDTISYNMVRNDIDNIVNCEEYAIEDLLISAYKASDVIIRAKDYNKDKFKQYLISLNSYLERLIIIPSIN